MSRRFAYARVVAAVTVAVALACALGACGGGDSESQAAPTIHADRFDAKGAWRLIKLQLAYGQRTAGSPQLRRMADRLRPLLPEGRFGRIPGDPLLRNVIGTVPGRQPAVVIGAHYDVLAKPKGFVGANNGAAGSAIVIELARTLAHAERPADAPELRFVLFDGEEPARGTPEESDDFYGSGLRGSRAYVAARPGQTRAMILLDYVANKGLRLPREQTSTPSLWREVRAAAARAGTSEVFPPETGEPIIDDHTPFLRAGVPAVDMIDWSYPGHDVSDKLFKLSRHSVDAVGETLVEMLAPRRR